MPALDAAALRQLEEDLGGDREVLAQVLASFLEEASAQLKAGRDAAAGARAEQVQSAYHSVKGAAATIGALLLSEACREIEQAARTGAIPARERVDEVERRFADVKRELLARMAAPT